MKKLLTRLRPDNNLDEVKSLYKTPERENGFDMPRYQVFKPGLIQQADLLYLPEDNIDDDKKYFWKRVKPEDVKPVEKKLYDNINRSFLDTDDKITYIITDVVKPSKISKTKKGLYYKYLSLIHI